MAKRKIEKVFLIFPPTTFSREGMKQACPPLGIAYIAAVLKDECNVKLLDASVEGHKNEIMVNKNLLRYGLSYQEIEKRIEEVSPDMVGISCLYSGQYPSAREICKRTKDINKDIITVIGGTHPSFLARECMEDKNLDSIVIGEGEYTMRDLIRKINDGVEDFSNLDGLAFRENGKVQINPKTEFIQDLDEIPYPARELLPMEKYFEIDLPMGIISKRNPHTTIMTSRGCRSKCTFCSSSRFWGNRYRARTPANILDEMGLLVEKYGVGEIKFFDDSLTLDKKRAKEIFRGMIERRLNLTWNAPNGVALWTLDDEMLDLMKRSGCYELTLAIESGDQEVLTNIVKKPINLKMVEPIVKKLKNHKIDTYGFFIIGFPGETKKQIKRTLDFASRLKLDRISTFIANPLPGTEMLTICQKKGYVNKRYRFEEIDYFHPRFETKEFRSKDVERMRRNWFWRHNLGLLIRNPIKFIKRYGYIIFKRPELLINIIFKKNIRLGRPIGG